MQSSSNVVVTDTPVIDDQNISVIMQKADICFSYNKSFSWEETLKKYNLINTYHDTDESIKFIPGAMDLFNRIIWVK